MLRSVNQAEFLKVLHDRPASIRNLVNPAPEYLARCCNSNAECLSYMPEEWKTVEVLSGWMKIVSNQNHFYQYCNIQSFPITVRDSLPEAELRVLCAKHENATTLFPNAPHDLWMNYVRERSYYNFEDIPMIHRTEDLLIEVLVKNRDFPEEFLTDSIIDQALEKHADVLNRLPKHMVTEKRIRRAFEKSPDHHLNNDLPVSGGQALADFVMATAPKNLGYIPKQFITKEMALNAVKDNCGLLIYVPASIMDEEIVLEALTTGKLYRSEELPKKFFGIIKGAGFLYKLAVKDQEKSEKDVLSFSLDLWGIENYKIYVLNNIPIEEWIKVIKIVPRAIKYIEKADQSKELMQAFLETAPVTVIDQMFIHLNLQRITKEHVPFLIGTTKEHLQNLVSRKIKGSQRKNAPEVAVAVATTIDPDTQIGMDLTDGEYRELKSKYNNL